MIDFWVLCGELEDWVTYLDALACLGVAVLAHGCANDVRANIYTHRSHKRRHGGLRRFSKATGYLLRR